MSITLHAFGDSIVVGDLDDYLHLNDPNVKPNHRMPYDVRIKYLKHNVSFVSILAKHYGYNLENYAVRGSGNYPQLDRVWSNLVNGKIKSGDIILFGFGPVTRDRLVLQTFAFDPTVNEKTGPHLLDRDLLSKENWVANGEQPILEMDFYYINSVLNRLGEQFNVRMIRCNLGDNALYHASDHIKKICEVEDFVGYNVVGNTYHHILNDSWGQPIVYPFSANLHKDLKLKPEHEYLYTYYRHPSAEGHKKIAQWWIDNNIIA